MVLFERVQNDQYLNTAYMIVNDEGTPSEVLNLNLPIRLQNMKLDGDGDVISI